MNSFGYVPAPPPVPQQGQAEAGCEYSVPLDHSSRPTYQCFTQAEWDAKQAHEAQVAAEQRIASEQFWSEHGLGFIIGFWAIVAILIFFSIKSHIKEHRLHREHPYLYDNSRW